MATLSKTGIPYLDEASRAAHSRGSGPDNPNWQGGRSIASNGYVLIRVGVGHHLGDVRGYAYEHRLVAEEMLGRRLLPGEIVHHVNGDKTDNRRINLRVEPSRRHHHADHRGPESGLRGMDEPNSLVKCACGCGVEFLRFDRVGRPRRYISGHNIQGGA